MSEETKSPYERVIAALLSKDVIDNVFVKYEDENQKIVTVTVFPVREKLDQVAEERLVTFLVNSAHLFGIQAKVNIQHRESGNNTIGQSEMALPRHMRPKN